METTKQRPALQSILFILNECIDSFDSLKELEVLHKKIISMTTEERQALLISACLVPHIVSAIRDHLCIRLRNLVDMRKDSHSLKEHFHESLIKKLEKEPAISMAIKAANKNVAHIDKDYTSWPPVEMLLTSNVKDILQAIKLQTWLTK